MQVKILVVDDSSFERQIIKNTLNEYCILTACDCAEAMRMLEEHDEINLLILDLNMPEMNGFQVLEFLKADKRFKKLRTIILTYDDEPDNEIRGLKLGAVDYIRKPIYADLLKARIELHVTLLCAERELEEQIQKQVLASEVMFKHLPVGVAISHNKESTFSGLNKYFKVNPAFERITGRSEEELLQLGWAAITHPDDLDEDLRNYQKLVNGEIDYYAMDKRFIRPDGSVVWVNMIVANLDLGKYHHFNHIALFKDITENKLLEQKLTESERSKSVLLSHLPGMAYRCCFDREWTMQFVSSGCIKLTGYTPESLINNRDLSYNDLIVPEYRELVWKKWKRAAKNKKDFRCEYEIMTASGERKWVMELAQAVYNENGHVEALEGIIIDISDRKAIENALKYNNEHDRLTGLYNRDYLEALFKSDARFKRKSKKAFIGINLSPVHLLTANYGFHYTENLIKK